MQDPLAFDLFDERLFAGGYLDAQAPAYGTGYTVRLANIFLVAEGFPRIVESDRPAGVGDVVYSIAVGALTPFAIDASTLPLIRRPAVADDLESFAHDLYQEILNEAHLEGAEMLREEAFKSPG